MKDYYLIKEVNGIPFILGQFDTEDGATKAFPTNSKGQYGITFLVKVELIEKKKYGDFYVLQ